MDGQKELVTASIFNPRMLNKNYASRGPIIQKVRGISQELKNVSPFVSYFLM